MTRRIEEEQNGRGLMAALIGMVVLSGCGAVEEGPETRPMGEAVLSEEQLRESEVAVDFTTHVRPILEERCLYCHNPEEKTGGFDLSTRDGAMASGRSGPRIIPGNGAQSPLVLFVSTGNHAMAMPAVGTQVPAAEIDVLRRWINAGADWPAGARLDWRD